MQKLIIIFLEFNKIYLVIKPAHHWDPIKFGIVFLDAIKIIIISIVIKPVRLNIKILDAFNQP